MMMKIKVQPEGREGVWTADKKSLIDFLKAYPDSEIHNFIPNGGFMLGADWSRKAVIDEVKKSERLAVLTGGARKHNMNHALAVITDNKLFCFDIGEITDDDLLIN